MCLAQPSCRYPPHNSACRLVYRRQPVRQRLGTLALALVGSSTLCAVPTLAVLLDARALAPALVLGVAEALLFNTAAFALLSRAGSPLPRSVLHDDGGRYSGELTGAHKHGLGVYTYASGARYRGEWRENRKHGLGVYTFPSGAVYAGQMGDSGPGGIGVKRFPSGKVLAGRWAAGRLQEALPAAECSPVIEAAQRAAAASEQLRRELGGCTPGAVARKLLGNVAILTSGLVLWHWALRRELPKAVRSGRSTACGLLGCFLADTRCSWFLPLFQSCSDILCPDHCWHGATRQVTWLPGAHAFGSVHRRSLARRQRPRHSAPSGPLGRATQTRGTHLGMLVAW